MNVSFGLRAKRVLVAPLLGAALAGSAAAAGAAHADTAKPADPKPVAQERVLLKGSTTASYFWDDGSGRAGDTGMPAIGKPMQKGMFASPSWPLGTEGYVIYKGKKAPFFIGDRGPGVPSSNGIMLDIDAKTFADLTGGRFNPSTLMVTGNGGLGHIEVEYVVTKWGSGAGKKDHPVAFATGAYKRFDRTPAEPPRIVEAAPDKPAEKAGGAVATVAAPGAKTPAFVPAKAPAPAHAPAKVAAADSEHGRRDDIAQGESGPADIAGGLAVLAGIAAAGGAYAGRDRLRALVRR
ncbi:hypothetical protein HNP84_006310 [Thermocatellispora tengchongensis]|uniref:Htaa domain-containing protein n=1 Tax=Thermocatellispora tengchongensis TaxID=1073253 RepID=A0A840PF47_9ACTN|nr:hypothetical protein [Thermocatellispora tengchongensis]MBB5136563.1 hypothetical protein [Thermocatellispora tengchongensis]